MSGTVSLALVLSGYAAAVCFFIFGFVGVELAEAQAITYSSEGDHLSYN